MRSLSSFREVETGVAESEGPAFQLVVRTPKEAGQEDHDPDPEREDQDPEREDHDPEREDQDREAEHVDGGRARRGQLGGDK